MVKNIFERFYSFRSTAASRFGSRSRLLKRSVLVGNRIQASARIQNYQHNNRRARFSRQSDPFKVCKFQNRPNYRFTRTPFRLTTVYDP